MTREEALEALIDISHATLNTPLKHANAYNLLEALIKSHFDLLERVEKSRSRRRELFIKTEALRGIARLIDEMGDEVGYSEHLKTIRDRVIEVFKATEEL